LLKGFDFLIIYNAVYLELTGGGGVELNCFVSHLIYSFYGFLFNILIYMVINIERVLYILININPTKIYTDKIDDRWLYF